MKAYIYSFVFLALLAVAYAASECPEVDGEQATHLANPEDCSSFYKCLDGVAHLNLCPSGLEWNSELEVCDWPESANCVVESKK